MSAPGFCAVCGRTFLVGERVRAYVSTEGRHEVCELCAGRTEELGWLPADQDGVEERLRADAARRPNFLTKLFARPEVEEDAEEERPAPPRDAEPPSAPRPNPLRRLADLLAPASASDDLERESVDPRTNLEAVRESGGPPIPAPASPAKDERPAKEAEDDRPDPAGRGMRPRRLQPDLSPTGRFERAIFRFNAGEAGHTVAGLTRTLGAPSVSVGDLAGEDEVVRVTVAWELTWYQWGIDLGDELRPVFELAKGFEVGEIDAAARQWNASAHDGRVVMVAPGRAAEAGRPIHR